MTLETLSGIISIDNNGSEKRSSANVVISDTSESARIQAFDDASTSGARVFLCHVYEQGKRTHLSFCLPLNLLLEIARLNSADGKNNKSNPEDMINRPLMQAHVKEIAKYLIETDYYILPPFIFNSDTPIKVFAFGAGVVKTGYAVIPSNVVFYVTDGQHRLKAIEKAIIERPDLLNDSVTALVVQEEDIDQIHQDFADCAKNKPIPPALRASFDVSDFLSRISRQIAKELVIFNGRIDKISSTVGKDPKYLFTMSQLRVGMAEFIFGTSKKKTLDSCSTCEKNEYINFLQKAKLFYTEFANHNQVWNSLLQPSSTTINVDLYAFRQERIDFNSVGFQIISRIGHLIFFNNELDENQRKLLIETLANLDYSRNCSLWLNSVVIDDDNGGKKIIAQQAAIDKGFRRALDEVEKQTGISLK
jgi:DGQHR domain-containing protein